MRATVFPIPVVDLFAGPGGLGEGFSAITDGRGRPIFDMRLSIEKDHAAHRTLQLRALFRSFHKGGVPDAYYEYIRGRISDKELLRDRSVSAAVRKSEQEARLATLGETSVRTINKWISSAIHASDPWVLIGGPPCQVYSLAGRSRRRSVDPDFDKDEKHLLYKEYLRIIQKFQPAVFVMENVKGLLSSTHQGSRIFEHILEDLSRPHEDLEYEIRSFVTDSYFLRPDDFVIKAERYGVPQARHRVILMGVRRDYAHLPHSVLAEDLEGPINLRDALSGLPMIRSRLSREPDSFEAWLTALSEAPKALKGWRSSERNDVEDRMRRALKKSKRIAHTGGNFVSAANDTIKISGKFSKWVCDFRLGGVSLHETRRHMKSDLHRYMFSACFLQACRRVPTLDEFPKALLPNHRNVALENVPFNDRFRVQPWDLPSTTVVSHIGKDGHYYIHPDPAQCRTLTVREAARLQTFPDNYFFEGGRTEQYAQVGNAVPPYLASQLAKVVADFLSRTHRKRQL